MPTNKPRYSIALDKDLLQKVDDFRFENRYPSRASATVALICLGIEQIEKEKASSKKDAHN